MNTVEFADVDDKLLVVTTDKSNVLKFRVLYLCSKSVIVKVEALGDVTKWQGEEGELLAANLPGVAPEKGLLYVMMRDVEPRIAPGYIGCLNLTGRAECFSKQPPSKSRRSCRGYDAGGRNSDSVSARGCKRVYIFSSG